MPSRLARFATALAATGASLALVACGGERQDADEPEGEFPVEVTTLEFPVAQRLADTSDLVLGVENAGSETVPDVAVTWFVDEGSVGPFSFREAGRGLADPNRPVWILETKYPRLVGEPPPSGLTGASSSQGNTFAFGPLEPGQVKEMVWRLTAARAGSWGLNYEVAAGLHGNARAVSAGGGEVGGDLAVRITPRPQKQRVNNRGRVVDVR